jgi:hypothetical protein
MGHRGEPTPGAAGGTTTAGSEWRVEGHPTSHLQWESREHQTVLPRVLPVSNDQPRNRGVIRNAYMRTALALSFIRGPAINNWVLQ